MERVLESLRRHVASTLGNSLDTSRIGDLKRTVATENEMQIAYLWLGVRRGRTPERARDHFAQGTGHCQCQRDDSLRNWVLTEWLETECTGVIEHDREWSGKPYGTLARVRLNSSKSGTGNETSNCEERRKRQGRRGQANMTKARNPSAFALMWWARVSQRTSFSKRSECNRTVASRPKRETQGRRRLGLFRRHHGAAVRGPSNKTPKTATPSSPRAGGTRSKRGGRRNGHAAAK